MTTTCRTICYNVMNRRLLTWVAL